MELVPAAPTGREPVVEREPRMPENTIAGPRATGMTTSARRLAATTVRLGNPSEAGADAADPDVVLGSFDGPVLLDAWQRAPDVPGESCG